MGKLGWTTWLKPRRSLRNAADLRLEAGSDSMARRTDKATQREMRELT